ncbi:hypothetical protein [Halorussus halobius]|nr:hypothetical protein [Halorussus halobius]
MRRAAPGSTDGTVYRPAHGRILDDVDRIRGSLDRADANRETP